MRFPRLLVPCFALGLAFAPGARAATTVSVKKCMPIVKPGTYLLTANLTTLGGCFLVQSDNVLINLMGYTITGPGSGAAVADGGIAHNNVSVIDGFITGFAVGVELAHSNGRLDRLAVFQNSGDGVHLGGGVIIGVESAHNGGHGIVAGDFMQVLNSDAHNNTGNGIIAGDSTQVSGNSVANNGGAGINAGSFAQVANNNVRNNGDNGIHVINQAAVTGNFVGGNAGHGVSAGDGCDIHANSVRDSGGDGIHSGNRVNGVALVSILGNKVEGAVNGIVAGFGVGIQGNDVCVVSGNGITVGTDSSTIGNVVCNTGGAGIVANQSVVGSNTIRFTTGNGISITCPGGVFLNVLGDIGGTGIAKSGGVCNDSGNIGP
jgi:hypothetical protein